MALEKYRKVEERILLQENIGKDLYKIALRPGELNDAENELRKQRIETLKIIEKNIWMEKSWFERLALQIVGKKDSCLEEILQEQKYRAHSVCQTPLCRYDLYEKQVQIGYDLENIGYALQKMVGIITKYQQEWASKKKVLHRSCEQIRHIESIEEITKKNEKILASLQEYLKNYHLLQKDQQTKLQNALHTAVGYTAKKEAFSLNDAISRDAITRVAEKLKGKNKTEMYRQLDELEVIKEERDRLDGRLREICASTEKIDIEFRRMKLKGHALKDDFQALGLAKKSELLDPGVTEQMRTAERHHQETIDLLNKNDKIWQRSIHEINLSDEEKVFEQKVEEEVKLMQASK